mmetsp:Transcript_30912/g.67733  ORF Transcript_30912/g.67733 Transcript_30912/m.67733 type:complete len:207 (+) Transcript_30912:1959-2579(+)
MMTCRTGTISRANSLTTERTPAGVTRLVYLALSMKASQVHQPKWSNEAGLGFSSKVRNCPPSRSEAALKPRLSATKGLEAATATRTFSISSAQVSSSADSETRVTPALPSSPPQMALPDFPQSEDRKELATRGRRKTKMESSSSSRLSECSLASTCKRSDCVSVGTGSDALPQAGVIHHNLQRAAASHCREQSEAQAPRGTSCRGA